jgi:hypothetical protein
LKVVGNKILRIIFEPNQDKVTGSWKTVCEEFYNSYFYVPAKRAEYVVHKGKLRNA